MTLTSPFSSSIFVFVLLLSDTTNAFVPASRAGGPSKVLSVTFPSHPVQSSHQHAPPMAAFSSSTALQANLFDRLARVTRANVNNAIKNLEDPEKVMDQAVLDMQRDLIKVKQSYAELTATYRRLLKQKQKADSVARDWHSRAELALTRGHEDLARQALGQRQTYVEEAENLKMQVDAQAASMDKLFEGIQLLEEKIMEARAKKATLASRAKKAKAIKKTNEMVSGLTAETNSLLGSVTGKNGAVDAYKRMEEKVEALEAAAEASAEMAALGALGSEKAESTLEQQFMLLEGAANVDWELEKLKKDLSNNALPASTSTLSIENELDKLKSEKKTVKIPVNYE
mmetsp:Transcript_28522/g.66344  ORF Transcript_28522/g.66344 Transcript_28522/m.66344 type:complete len:342 (-) Transcript_28522:60-1085(-)